MRIKLSQLRNIIKEEVSRSLNETPARGHERSDEARSQLSLGMRSWLRNPSSLHAWQQMTAAIYDLELEGMSDDGVLEEVQMIASQLGYSDDDMMEIHCIIKDWLKGSDI